MNTSVFGGQIQGWLIGIWYRGATGIAASTLDDALGGFGLQGLALDDPGPQRVPPPEFAATAESALLRPIGSREYSVTGAVPILSAALLRREISSIQS